MGVEKHYSITDTFVRVFRQNATVNALGEMGDFLTSSDSARDVENVAKSLGSAIGNVVGASIDSYQKAANGTSAGDPVSTLYDLN